MNRKVKISLHLIESYYNLENELSMITPLRRLTESEFSDLDDLESDEWEMICDLAESEDIPLFEHRGKPDPEKARARQESRMRGKERHKNALERSRREELLRKAREAERRRKKAQGIEDDEDDVDEQTTQQQYQKQQQTKQQKVQQQRNQQLQDAQEKMNQQDADKVNLKAKQSKAQLDSDVKKMINSAPTPSTKRHSKSISQDIDDLNKNIVSAFAKLTPAERKRRKEKEREAMKEKYDQIEDKYMKKMETPEERAWFKKNFSKIKRVGVGTADNVFDLMGYKTVYADVAEATKFILGKKT